jgi:hypothetical protein
MARLIWSGDRAPYRCGTLLFASSLRVLPLLRLLADPIANHRTRWGARPAPPGGVRGRVWHGDCKEIQARAAPGTQEGPSTAAHGRRGPGIFLFARRSVHGAMHAATGCRDCHEHCGASCQHRRHPARDRCAHLTRRLGARSPRTRPCDLSVWYARAERLRPGCPALRLESADEYPSRAVRPNAAVSTEAHRWGPASCTRRSTVKRAKFATNLWASARACSSYADLSAQVLRGLRLILSTPRT